MVNFTEKLKELISRHQTSQRKLAGVIGISYEALKQQLKKNNIPIDKLDLICLHFNVSPNIFFSNHKNMLFLEATEMDKIGDQNRINAIVKENEHMKELLLQQQQIIEDKQKLIELYERSSKNSWLLVV